MTVPEVLITPSAASAIIDEALLHPFIETACGLVGFIFPNDLPVIVGTVPAPVLDIVRKNATVSIGGVNIAAAMKWLYDNYKVSRLHLGEPDMLPLEHLWYAHSHQQIGMKYYSGTDETSMLEAITKHGFTLAVGPLVNITHFSGGLDPIRKTRTFIRGKRRSEVELRFYYLSKKMVDAGITKPIIAMPRFINEKKVPSIPSLPWVFADEAHYAEQLRHIHAIGATVIPLHRNVDDDPIQELQLIVKKEGEWKGSLIITTQPDFPASEPSFQVVGDYDTATPGKEVLSVKVDKDGNNLWSHPGADFIEVISKLIEMELL